MDELRERLVKSIAAIIFLSCLAYSYVDQLLAFIVRPVGQLIYTSPADAFVVHIHLALFTGFLLSSPIVLYQVWRFVACGLREEERKYITTFGPVSFMLFALGTLFAFFIVIPISLQFLLSFSSEDLVPMITIKSYISFVATLILAFGAIFELPLVLLFLTKIGIATPAFLIQKRKYAIVINLIVSALITPPDLITLWLMAVPLSVLYEIGIIVSKLATKDQLVCGH